MPLLTADQLERLRQIIRDASTAVAISTTGMRVSDEQLQALAEAGYVDPSELHDVVLDSFELGRIMAALPEAKGWSFQQLKNHLAKNPVELSDQERRAVDHLKTRAGQFCVGLGTRAEGNVTLSVADMDQELAEAFRYNIQNEAAQAVARRETVGRLTTRLRQMSQDWARDWGRIASTESHMAHQMGYIESTAEQYGSGEMLAKIPEDSACDDCRRLYLGPDGKPRVEPIDWWMGNGVANYGRKRADWQPVMGAMHPWCLLPGSEVETATGRKRVEDVAVGDMALQSGGTWGQVTALFRRYYAGDAVKVSLSNGEVLRVTSGHSVLGACGHWQFANLLQEGAQLRGIRVPDPKDGPAVAAQEPLFARIFFGFDGAGMPVAAVHFNGEFARPIANVDQPSANELIVLKAGDPRLIQEPLDHDLSAGQGLPLDPSEPVGDLFVGINLPAARFVSRSGVQLALLGAHLFHADLLAFRTRALADPSLMEALDDGAARYPETSGYLLYGQIVMQVHRHDIGLDLQPTSANEDPMVSESGRDSCPGHSKSAPNGVDGHPSIDVHGPKLAPGDGDFPHVTVQSVQVEEFRGDCFNVTVEATNTYVAAGVVNKNCQCQSVRVPAGWGFDDNWDIVPIEEDEAAKSHRPTLTVQAFQKSRKLHGKMRWRGLEVSIENRKGSVRKWYDRATKTEGETKMRWPYGYLNLTEGADGDHVDCFMGPELDTATHVYVVHQMKAPHFDRYDEDKVMVGWPTAKAAKAAYLQHFDRPGFFGSMDAIPVERFVQRVKDRKLQNGKRIQKARRLVVKSSGQFRGNDGYVGMRREVGTMGNVGQPARTAGENTFAAQPTTDHPYGPDARKKKRKKKRKKRDRSQEKKRIAVSPVSYVDGYVRDKPAVELRVESQVEQNRQWVKDQQQLRAKRADTGRLTISPNDVR